MATMVGSERRERMKLLLAQREREGLTYAELAKLTGESRHGLSWWAWKLRQESRGVRGRRKGFVEVELAADARVESGEIEVILAHGRRLSIRPGFDESTLRRIVAVLESPC